VRVIPDVANSNNESNDRDSEQVEIDDPSHNKSEVYSVDPTATTLNPPQIMSSTKEIKEEVCTDDCSPNEKLQNLCQRESSAPSSSSSSLDADLDLVVDIDLVELDNYLEGVQQSTSSYWNLTLQ
jgi:hypothetical protein